MAPFSRSLLNEMAMAEIPAPARRPLRFGSFELDPASGELRKAGVVVALPEQSLKVLVELVERPGDLVTREQLRQRLWPNGTFVDFEHGLNAVINRLRETLGDSAESPRFIQTVPRRGYRFIAPVEGGIRHRQRCQNRRPEASKHAQRPWMVIGAAGIILVVAAIALLRQAPSVESPSPRVVAVTRLAGRESGPAFAPDGEQVAFVWSGEKFDNTDIYVTLAGATNVRRLTTDPADDFAPSWSPDGRRIAFLRKFGNSARIHLASALGGPDSKLSDFPVGITGWEGDHGAQIAWSPDGRHVVAGRDPRFSDGGVSGLYLIPVEGGEPRAITRPAPPSFDLAPVFSADGRRLAYLACGSIGVFLPLLLPDRCAVRMTDVDNAGLPTTAPRTLTTQPIEPAGLAWSRDGRSIVFAMGAPGPVRLWRLWVDPLRAAERIEIAGESVDTRRRPRRATDWRSHESRWTRISIASTPAVLSRRSRRPRRLRRTRTFPRMAGTLRLAQGAPATFRSGSRRPTGRTPASSPTTCANGQARLHGRRMDARSRSTAAAVAPKFASGPSTPMAAPRARSRRTRQPVGAPVVSRREMDLFRERTGSDARYLAGAYGWRAAATGDPDGQRLRRL